MTKRWAGAVFPGHVEHWKEKLRKPWPEYAFHFTGIRNAARILASGELLSRTEAMRRGVMEQDNAAPSVIKGTNQAHLNFARMYFRPRTPTQYRNEGFLTATQRSGLNAHCAVPVFFLFDFVSVASLDATQFSTGNLGSSSAVIGGSREFFEALPFEDIFSTGGMGARAQELTRHRAAEIVVPTSLPLTGHLKAVLCRSHAERQTLFQLLPESERRQWDSLVRVSTDATFFERRGQFVEQVVPLEDELHLQFNPTVASGPFELVCTFVPDGKSALVRRIAEWNSEPVVFRFREAADINHQSTSGEVTVTLDGELAFCGRVSFEFFPF